MVLVDTSVWIDHFRKSNAHLRDLLLAGQVACHPLIIGELACGTLKNRSEILSLLHTLFQGSLVGHEEIIHFIDRNQLMGLGVGIVDIHLLASSVLSSLPLWTIDKSLLSLSLKLRVSYQ